MALLEILLCLVSGKTGCLACPGCPVRELQHSLERNPVYESPCTLSYAIKAWPLAGVCQVQLCLNTVPASSRRSRWNMFLCVH